MCWRITVDSILTSFSETRKWNICRGSVIFQSSSFINYARSFFFLLLTCKQRRKNEEFLFDYQSMKEIGSNPGWSTRHHHQLNDVWGQRVKLIFDCTAIKWEEDQINPCRWCFIFILMRTLDIGLVMIWTTETKDYIQLNLHWTDISMALIIGTSFFSCRKFQSFCSHFRTFSENRSFLDHITLFVKCCCSIDDHLRRYLYRFYFKWQPRNLRFWFQWYNWSFETIRISHVYSKSIVHSSTSISTVSLCCSRG